MFVLRGLVRLSGKRDDLFPGYTRAVNGWQCSWVDKSTGEDGLADVVRNSSSETSPLCS